MTADVRQPGEDGADVASPLIRTKLAPPRIGSERLARERLVGILDAGRHRRLALIVGPAGSGKTTLAALWRRALAERGCDVAWYNVGEDDDEALWAEYLRAAFEQCGLAVPAFPSSARDGGYLDVRPYVATLVNALYAHPRPIYLFIDDLSYARLRRAHDLIDALLAYGPDNFHVVVTARTLPLLAIVGLRVKDQVTQVEFEHLRFNAEEQAQFLARQGIGVLSEKQAKNLQTLTDGWAAGLQLAAYSLKKARSYDDYFARWNQAPIRAEERSLYGYLDEVVRSALTPHQIATLVRMAACRRFTEDLCVLVSGDPDAGDVLAALESEGLFVLPIESGDGVQWYRFHRIFAHYLMERLGALPEAELASINQRACGWFAARGLFAEAMRHARYAGDDMAMVALVERAARPMICSAHFAQLLERIDQLPRPLLGDRLELLLPMAWAQVVCGRLGDFQESVRQIERHPRAAEPAVAFELTLQRALDRIRRDDTAAVPQLLAPYIDVPPSRDLFLLLMTVMAAGLSHVGNGRYELARDVVYDYRRNLDRARFVRVRPYLDSIVGLSCLRQGDFVQARETLAQLFHDIRREGRIAGDSSAHVAGYLAEVHYQLDDLDTAENYVDECIDTAEIIGTADCSIHVGTVQARLHFEAGAFDAALAALDGMERKAQDEGWDRLAAWSLAERVRIESRRSRPSMAHEALRRLRRLAARYSEMRECAWADIPLAAEIAEADLALADGDWAAAATLASTLAERLHTQRRYHLAARMRIVAALAVQGGGDVRGAIEVARPAVADAARFCMSRVLRDEGPAGLHLLAELCKADGFSCEQVQFLEQCAQRVRMSAVAAPDAASPAAPTARSAGLERQEALTPREREIVQLLGRALSLKSVAKVLNVSVGTVKWHLRNAYAKLGVYSREGAVARARELLIIE